MNAQRSEISLENQASRFVENSADFSACCLPENGRCQVVRENILFIDDGTEPAAVEHLQRKCEHVVIIPDMSHKERALLYHTSCQRMTDVVKQIFRDCLEAPVSFPQRASEITLGEMHRRCVTISYDDCRERVEDFGLQGASQG
jgi:hypothetical protein